MKKNKKIGLFLGFLGISMIVLAIFLQYQTYRTPIDKKQVYQSLKQSSNIKVKQINQDEIEETIENPFEEPTEEITIEDEIKEVTTYEDVTTLPVEPIVYDNLTLKQLSEKLERSLKANLSGMGYLIAKHSIELGVDPYLAVAIMLHETGCNSGSCSSLVVNCNNVGGQKGGPSCGGGSYKAYPSLEEGIVGYIDNLYNNYVSKGLTTAEQMGPKYAASPTWISKVNQYIEIVKTK